MAHTECCNFLAVVYHEYVFHFIYHYLLKFI